MKNNGNCSGFHILVATLLVRQFDMQAHGLAPGLKGPLVGRFHDAGAAAGDDAEARVHQHAGDFSASWYSCMSGVQRAEPKMEMQLTFRALSSSRACTISDMIRKVRQDSVVTELRSSTMFCRSSGMVVPYWRLGISH